MYYTTKYSIYSFLWFSLFPVLTFMSGKIGDEYVATNSLFWVGGLCLIFYFWASLDSKIFNISKNTVNWFTAGWILLPIIIVIPYLYVSRGRYNGTIATIKYICLCILFFFGTGIVLKVYDFFTNL